MRRRQKVWAATGLAQVRLGRRVPVAARINVNNQCHSRCSYCSFWSTPTEEMDTAELCGVIGELGELGCQRLSLSGGEPMLREDIGEVVAAGADAGISVSMNATGYLFAERTDALQRLDLVKLSLDGREAVHDETRGREGAYKELLEGIEVCRELGVRYAFAFTMTRANLADVPYAVDLAQAQDTFVAFQPVMAHHHAHRNARAQYPDRAQFLAMVDWLIEQKRAGNPAIRNSLGGLQHIRAWPSFDGSLRCYAGHAFVMVEANGDVVPCDRITYPEPLPNVRDAGLATALDRLPDVHCPGCGYLGSLEINRLLNLRADAAPAILKVVTGG